MVLRYGRRLATLADELVRERRVVRRLLDVPVLPYRLLAKTALLVQARGRRGRFSGERCACLSHGYSSSHARDAGDLPVQHQLDTLKPKPLFAHRAEA